VEKIMKTLSVHFVGLTVVLVLGMSKPAQANLVLTPAGVADGFSLSVFAMCCGSTENAITTTSSGNVLVTRTPPVTPATFSFNDVDGQTVDSWLAISSVGMNNFGITNAQGNIYAVNMGTGNIDLLNNDGSFNSIFLALPGGLNGFDNSITTDLANGDIYVDSGNGINDIDPATKTVRLVNSALGDGIAVSPDGSTVYLAVLGTIFGYNTTTGATTFSASVPGANGIGVIQGGVFSNYLVVNTTGGLVDLVNPAGTVVTTIANSGTNPFPLPLGGLVGYDYNNGSLFLVQNGAAEFSPTTIYRLATVPEPGTIVLALIGLGSLSLLKHIRG
jgi:PEP-CTERM motif